MKFLTKNINFNKKMIIFRPQKQIKVIKKMKIKSI